MAGKWRIFKEKLPPHENPMWVVWDESRPGFSEFLFDNGSEALAFVNREMSNRKLASTILWVQEGLP